MSIVLPDIIAAGIYNSDIAAKNKVITKTRKTTMFELEIPIENGGISYLNSDNKKIVKNMMICAKPGQSRHSKLPYKCYYIHMIVHSGELYDVLTSVPDFINISNPQKFIKIFEKISQYFQSGLKNDEIMLQSLVLQLVYELKAVSLTNSEYNSKPNNHIIVENIINYIKDNLSSNLTLSEISKQVSFSPVYLHNMFKASTGKTIREFVEDKRIAKSINLLTTTNMTLTEIAYECGFSSQAYFSYAFKKKMKLPPKIYAKEIIERYNHNKTENRHIDKL